MFRLSRTRVMTLWNLPIFSGSGCPSSATLIKRSALQVKRSPSAMIVGLHPTHFFSAMLAYIGPFFDNFGTKRAFTGKMRRMYL
jgi:hypothetical protein